MAGKVGSSVRELVDVESKTGLEGTLRSITKDNVALLVTCLLRPIIYKS